MSNLTPEMRIVAINAIKTNNAYIGFNNINNISNQQAEAALDNLERALTMHGWSLQTTSDISTNEITHLKAALWHKNNCSRLKDAGEDRYAAVEIRLHRDGSIGLHCSRCDADSDQMCAHELPRQNTPYPI